MKNRLDNPLGSLLRSDDCSNCRLCCKFGLDDCSDAPTFDQNQMKKILDNHYEKNISFNRIGKLYKIVLDPIIGRKRRFICPLYDESSGKCRIYSYRSFDCITWPFYITKSQNRILIALNNDCPSVAKKYAEIDNKKAELDRLILYMIMNAQKNPDLITKYISKYKIVSDVTDMFYSKKN